MSGRVRVLVAAVAAGALVAAIPAAPAAAATTGSAHSAAAQASAGSGLNPNATPSGLLALLSSLVNGVVNPLLDSLTSLPQQTLVDVASGLTGSGLQADNGSALQTRPAAGSYPTCGSGGWTASNCYGPLAPAISAGVITLATGAVQGYATGDSAGYVAAAHVAAPQLTVLGIPIGNLGVVDASASCTSSSCSATQSVSGGSLLGGISLSVSNGTTLASIGGVPIPAAGVGISASGVTGTVALNGNLLTMKLALSLTQLLDGLGLGSVLGLLSGVLTTGTTVTLTVTVGPGSHPVSGSTAAWGLDVGVDLSADIKLSVLGLAGVEVTAGGSSAPDLLDLELAYATAAAGTASGPSTQWVPPGLI